MNESEEREPKFRVLVVDDNRDGADSLAMLLRMWGYGVQVVYDGVAAVAAARANRPDCILSDIGLPGIDGYRMAEQLRGDESFKTLPLIRDHGLF